MELIDSSEFHGSTSKELKYYEYKIKQLLENKRLIKIVILVILWFVGGRIGKKNYFTLGKKKAINYSLEGIYVVVTGFLLIFSNLGKRE